MGMQVFKSSSLSVRGAGYEVRSHHLRHSREGGNPDVGPGTRRTARGIGHAARGILHLASMVCLLVAVRAPAACAQETPRLTEWSDVSVITILPGDPLYSSFGHTAIRVRDDSADIDVGYNYGTFDFDEEGFYVKFLRGKLDY